MIRSIQTRMILIFVLLVLLTMEIIGAYLMQSLEKYYLNDFRDRLKSQAYVLGGLVQRYIQDPARKEHIQQLVESLEGDVEVTVVDAGGFVVYSSDSRSTFVGRALPVPEITSALSGMDSQETALDPRTGERLVRVTVPVRLDGTIAGAVSLERSLEGPVYKVLGEIGAVLLSATLIAMGIIAILGFAIARTVTGPIMVVTRRAREMASGDFDGQIEVRSDDEIGQLARVFNYLARRLKDTLGEIRREKSKVEAIVGHMANGLLAVDATGRIILLNSACAEMLGADSKDLIGKEIGVLEGLDLKGPLDQVLAGENKVAREFSLGHPTERVLTAKFAPFLDETGGVNGVVVVFQDVTEQRRLDELRREFIGNVSHELRTPLTTIKTYLETLVDGAVHTPELASKFLQVISSETERMVRMVNDLLELSKIDYKAEEWEIEEVSMRDVLDESVARLDPEVRRKRLKIEVCYQQDTPFIKGNHDKLLQLFINILSNSVEFTPDEGIITIDVSQSAGTVVVRVTDSGIGIPKEDVPRIFERFYRVDKARSRRLGGSGLGLAIAREIVERHGGSIQVESEEGKGTTVTVALPIEGVVELGGAVKT